MKLTQKGVVRVTVSLSEIVGMVEKATGLKPMGEAMVLLTRGPEEVLHIVNAGLDETITVQWIETQKDEDHGSGVKH